MSFFKKILGKIIPSGQDENKSPEESKYLPEKKLPIDEEFIVNFKHNGGRFLYCSDIEDLEETFISILEENDWFEKEAICFEDGLQHFLTDNNVIHKNPTDPQFMLCSCESLIAKDGSILFSSAQFIEHKPAHLPYQMVVLAKASQITRSKSDGLRKIKYRYGSNIPSNITTLQNFSDCQSDEFLQYGSVHKNLYLLLLEDM